MLHRFVQYGCGFTVGEGWLNFDASPTLRIERIPLFGNIISAIVSGNGSRFPSSVRYGDIRRGPLVPPGTAEGVYASHVLEHLSLSDFQIALTNTYEMLADGGVFRLIVPDLYERARIYVSTARQKPDSAEQFIRATMLGKEYRPRNLSEIIHDIVGNSNHLWMWDETSLAMELAKQGFTMIRRCNLGDSGIAMFDAVEKSSRFYDNDLGIQECAMEARKYLKNDPVVD